MVLIDNRSGFSLDVTCRAEIVGTSPLAVPFTYLGFLNNPAAGPAAGLSVAGMILVVCLVAAWLFREPLGTLAGTYYQIFGVRIAHAWLLRLVLILANVIVAVLLTIFGA